MHRSFRLLQLVQFSLALLALAGAMSGARARAEAISYSLTFCESLDVLKDPTNTRLQANAAWKTQHALMLERTMPYFELRNTSVEAELTRLTLSIGDETKNFDWAQMIEASPGVTFTLDSIDAVAGGLKSDSLQISFQGLGPGEFVRFRTGLSPDAAGATMIVDYRKTLFDLNGGDTSGNANVAVMFSSEDGDETLEGQLPNYENPEPTTTSMAFANFRCVGLVLPYAFIDEGTLDPPDGGEPVVPEPASLVLLGTGAAGMFIWRRRRVRR